MGDWLGGGVGRWRAPGACVSVHCPAACVSWGVLALCQCPPFDCGILCWQTNACIFPLVYGKISMQRCCCLDHVAAFMQELGKGES